MSSEKTNVRCSDESERFGGFEAYLDGRGEYFAHKIGSQAVHEGNGAKDGIQHLCVGGFGFEMGFNVEFADEMRHVGRVDIGLISASVNGSVDENFDIVGDGLIHYVLSLLRFAFLGSPVPNSLLDAENAPDGYTA